MDTRKKTPASKNLQKSNDLNILVLGETGSGKSTFINTITNFFRGGQLNHLKIAIPTRFHRATEEFRSNESDLRNVSSSKTDSCSVYRFTHGGINYNFIDTPGLADTRGPAQDEKNLAKILDFASQLGNIVAIVIVINGTTPRLTVNIKTVLTQFRGSLPDVLLNNIIVVFTNCLEHNRNFDINQLAIRPRKTFHMNNSAFSSDSKTWSKTAIKSLSTEWDLSMGETKKLAKALSKMRAITTTAFTDMKNIRFLIKQKLHQARLEITRLQAIQDEIAAAEKILSQHKADSNAFQNYTKKNTVTTKELKDAPYHSTLCSTCTHVCHNNCGLQEISTKGDNAFKGCAAMGGGDTCHYCPKRCSYTTHYHGRKTVVEVTQTLEEVLDDIKKKYDQAQQGTNQASQKIKSIHSTKDMIARSIAQLESDIGAECQKLKKICSGFNLVDELSDLIDQLKMESKSLVSLEAKDSSNKFIRAISHICNSMAPTQSPSGSRQNFQEFSDEDSSSEEEDEEDEDEKPNWRGQKSRAPRNSFSRTEDPFDDEAPWERRSNQTKPKKEQTFRGPNNPSGNQFGQPKKSFGNAPPSNQYFQPPLQQDYNQMTQQFQNFQVQPRQQRTVGQQLPQYPDPRVSQMNGMLQSSGANALVCKVCSQGFFLLDSEKQWFTARNIPPPKTCKSCRDKNKGK